MFRTRISVLIVFVAFTILSASTALAQPSPGTISGTVRVETGPPIGGATVTITNQETGATRAVRSSEDGSFEAADLPPGLYTVSVDVQGFVKMIQKDRRVAPGERVMTDLSLQVKVSEEVTVTAMKREETIFNTPVSVAAPTEEVLRERGVTDLEGVAANVANFSVQNLGPGQSTVALRGVSSGQIARDQPGVKEQVGAYLDESVISLSLFTPDMDLFDMNRVEVLRGPQGTLFGSGSVGGTVRYISNQPELGVTSTFGEVGGNIIDGGGMGGNFKAGFNAPLGSKAALRVATFYNRLAGWSDAVQPDFSIKPDVNAGDRLGVRLAMVFAPIEELTITPRFMYQKVAMDGWNRFDQYNILANPFTTTRTPITLRQDQLFTQIDEPFTDKFYLGDVKANYDFGNGINLTSITSFTNRDILVVRDSTALTGSVTGGSFGLPADVYTLDAPLKDKTHASGWSQEVRVSGDMMNSRLRWLAGAFYSDTDRQYNQDLSVQSFTKLSCDFSPGTCFPPAEIADRDQLYLGDIGYQDRQWGIFGEGTFALNDCFSLTAGLRYYNYEVDKALIFDGLFAPEFPNATFQQGTTKADGVAPRFIASYKVSENTTLNAQAAKGFRLGGINDPILVPLCSDEDVVTFGNIGNWQDETAWNYEIGSKTRLIGGRATINASVFYVDVRDLQAVVTAGTCSSRLVFNVPKARSVGGELEMTFAPTNNFDVALSASYNNAEVTQSLDGTEAAIHATGIRDGNRLPSVPEFQMALSATYQQPIAPTYWGYVTGNYQHVGSRYTQLVDQEPGLGIVPLQNVPGALGSTIGGPLTQDTFVFDPLLPAYDIVNLRFGVRHGLWDVAFYVNNITDETAFLSLDRERDFRARQGFLTNQPRTFGISTRFDF